MLENKRLPVLPIVEAEGRDIYITWEHDVRQFWGSEDNEEEALKAAEGMQFELRAIEYTKEVMYDTVSGLVQTLNSYGLDKDIHDVLLVSYRILLAREKFSRFNDWLEYICMRFRYACHEVFQREFEADDCVACLDIIDEIQDNLGKLKGYLYLQGVKRQLQKHDHKFNHFLN